MTSNERIILKCLWDAKGKAHICFISRTAGLNSDYARLLARSLERAGYLKFADANVCYLLTRGRSRFQNSGPIIETTEPDAIVNPEIVIETVSASISEKDEPSSEDESQNVDLDNDEEKITDSDSDEKKVDEKNEGEWKEKLDKTIEELESTDEENSEAGDEKLVEEIQNEILEEKIILEELVSDQGQDTEETKEEEPAKEGNGSGFNVKSIFSWFVEKK